LGANTAKIAADRTRLNCREAVVSTTNFAMNRRNRNECPLVKSAARSTLAIEVAAVQDGRVPRPFFAARPTDSAICKSAAAKILRNF
jgi:hypothetical protein